MLFSHASFARCVAAVATAGMLTLGAPETPVSADGKPQAPVDVEMRNVHLRVEGDITLDVAYLRGQMVSRTPGQPPVFDDPDSYVLHIGSGTVAMDVLSLEHLLNERVFAGPHSPLTDVHVSVDGARLRQSAKLHKGPIVLPVSMKASVAVSADGRLQLHVETEKALGIPTTGLLSLFGLEVDDLVSLKDRKGVELHDNDIFITPGLVVPPPEIQGALATAVVKDNRLVQTFAPDPAAKAWPTLHPPAGSKNYLYFSGSTLRFGKLTMDGADLQLVDMTPASPFDFSPREYLKQLVAGYSKTTPSGGLIAYMPDFAKVTRR
jgi:hypothetical protein